MVAARVVDIFPHSLALVHSARQRAYVAIDSSFALRRREFVARVSQP